MTLSEWLKAAGRGAAVRIYREAVVSPGTVYAAQRGRPVSYPVAKRISAATGGQVTVQELLDGSAGAK